MGRERHTQDGEERACTREGGGRMLGSTCEREGEEEAKGEERQEGMGWVKGEHA